MFCISSTPRYSKGGKQERSRGGGGARVKATMGALEALVMAPASPPRLRGAQHEGRRARQRRRGFRELRSRSSSPGLARRRRRIAAAKATAAARGSYPLPVLSPPMVLVLVLLVAVLLLLPDDETQATLRGEEHAGPYLERALLEHGGDGESSKVREAKLRKFLLLARFRAGGNNESSPGVDADRRAPLDGEGEVSGTVVRHYYEAEEYSSSGGSDAAFIRAAHLGHTGSGYVDMGATSKSSPPPDGLWIEWGDVRSIDGNGNRGNTYTVTFRYSSSDQSVRRCGLIVNGYLEGILNFANTGGWDMWGEESIHGIHLSKGKNKIRLIVLLGEGGPYVDRMALSLEEASDDEVQRYYPNCTARYAQSWIGDGHCDSSMGVQYNSAECGYDGGDCCSETCVPGGPYDCRDGWMDCRDRAVLGEGEGAGIDPSASASGDVVGEDGGEGGEAEGEDGGVPMDADATEDPGHDVGDESIPDPTANIVVEEDLASSSLCPVGRRDNSTKHYGVKPSGTRFTGVSYMTDSSHSQSNAAPDERQQRQSHGYSPIVWMGGDGGGDEINAVDLESGSILRTFHLNVTVERGSDWETISLGPCGSDGWSRAHDDLDGGGSPSSPPPRPRPCLYLGNVGNDFAQKCVDRSCTDGREEVYVYKVVEPDIFSAPSNPEVPLLDVATLRLNYFHQDLPTNRADCGSMFVDWTGDSNGGKPGDIYLVTKWFQRRDLQRLVKIPVDVHEPLKPGEMTTFPVVPVATPNPVDKVWNDADMSMDGNLITLRTPSNVRFYPRPRGTTTVARALEGMPCGYRSRTRKETSYAKKYESFTMMMRGGRMLQQDS